MFIRDSRLVTIRPDGSGRWIVELPAGEPRRTMLMKFGIAAYPFESFYLHAAFPDDDGPRTFDRVDWNHEGRGLRVGPWPGWRGIPALPPVQILVAGNPCRTIPVFFGDELRRGVARLAVTLETADPVLLVVKPSDPRWIPLRAEFLPGTGPPVEPGSAALLPRLRGKHPRVFVAEEDIPVMRMRAVESHREHWRRIETLLDSDHGDAPAITPQAKLPDGPELLLAEDRVLLGAIAALVDPTPERIAQGRDALFAFIELTMRDDYAPLGIDTQCGEMLFVLSTGYDWMHPFLSHAEEVDARLHLFVLADRCAAFLPADRHDIAQAHFLGCALGLLAFSLVFYDEHPESASRVSFLHGALRRIVAMLPEDGFYPHGLNLWIYEHGFLLRWLELFRSCCGEDLWLETQYWRNASRFRAAATAPGGRFGITFGDTQYRVGGDAWCHMLVAKRTGDLVAQGLGVMLMEEAVGGVDYRCAPARRRVYEFLCDDPGMSMSATPERAHFLDGGQLFLRSDESLFTVRCGAPLGRQRRAAGECGGYGHSDPANGSFLVSDRGDFVVCGPGPSYRRDTAQHNVFTVDGLGQIGDGAVWFPDALPDRFIPPTPRTRALGSHKAIFMDLARSYHPDLGIRECTRTLFVEAGRRILGVDRMALQRPRSIEWNLHSRLPFSREETEDAQLRFMLNGAMPRALIAVTDPVATASTGLTNFVPAYPHDGVRDYFLRLEAGSDAMTVVWALDLRDSLTKQIDIEERGCVWTSHDGAVFRCDFSSMDSSPMPIPPEE